MEDREKQIKTIQFSLYDILYQLFYHYHTLNIMIYQYFLLFPFYLEMGYIFKQYKNPYQLIFSFFFKSSKSKGVIH